MRADDFHRVGGWDAVNTPIAHSDFDLSLPPPGRRGCGSSTRRSPSCGTSGTSRGATPARTSGLAVTRADRGVGVYFLHRWGERIATDPNYTSDMRELLVRGRERL